MESRFKSYLDKYQRWPLRGLHGDGAESAGIYIVIPAYRESDLQRTFRSLLDCETPDFPVHVVLVLNGPEEEEAILRKRYDGDRASLSTFWNEYRPLSVDFRLDILEYYFSARWAGVGSARKAGTDEVIAHLLQHQAGEAMVAFLDADCTVDDQYLIALEQAFEEDEETDIWSIYFEHDLNEVSDELRRRHMYLFELHLRYYRQAQRWCGFPYAFHTIGSCMAFRAGSYAKYAGMNRKKAGEDFYFFQKLASHGRASDLTMTCVYPSARLSERTPFGTGRALAEQYEKGEERKTFSLKSFDALRTLYGIIRETEGLHEMKADELLDALHPLLRDFLENQSFSKHWVEHQEHTPNVRDLRERFHQWMGGFRLLKWLHHARNRDWPDQPVTEQAEKLISRMTIEYGNADLLTVYRQLDRTSRITSDTNH